MYEALCDADAALRRFDAGAGRLDPHARPRVYQWIAALRALGQVDRTVTADHPLYAVFRKGAQRAYVAANLRDKPLAVSFSDGFRLDVGARRTAVGRRALP